MDTTQLSSNWKKLQAILKSKSKPPQLSEKAAQKRKRDPLDKGRPIKKQKSQTRTEKSERKTKNPDDISSASRAMLYRSKSFSGPKERVVESSTRPSSSQSNHVETKAEENEGTSATSFAGKYIAIDCEMVGVGPTPDRDSQLARVSVVNYHGEQLYDSYVKPELPVTDYRTHVSGIRPHHLKTGRPFKEVQQDMQTFLTGRILVGHHLRHDLLVLKLKHPPRDTRDTTMLSKYRELVGGKKPSLKELASKVLGLDIQNGEHSSVEDARAAMMLYKVEKDEFEGEIRSRFPQRPKNASSAGANFKKRR